MSADGGAFLQLVVAKGRRRKVGKEGRKRPSLYYKENAAGKDLNRASQPAQWDINNGPLGADQWSTSMGTQ
jgi:hypothetical protein